jgi:anti-anti-sigma factor
MSRPPDHPSQNPVTRDPGGGEISDGEFSMEEHAEETGRIRLGLIGELDLAGADRLRTRVEALADRGAAVLLDLHRLQFIDSTGIGELVRAVSDARREGRMVELDPMLSPQVRQLIDLLELNDLFWPT